MGYRFANNASSTLISGISDTDLSILVAAGEGARFPSLSAGEWFHVTIEDSGGNYEVVRVTARAGDQMTVVRAQESTTAKSFSIGSRVEMRLTAAALDHFIQDNGQTVAGDYTTSGTWTMPTIKDPNSSATLAWDGAGNGRLNLDGKPILRAPYAGQDPAQWVVPKGAIILWSGVSVPAGWAICDGVQRTGSDGANVTPPDLRNKFIPGAGDNYTLGQVGGATSYTTNNSGNHNHGSVTAYHTLSISQMPSHTHSYTAYRNSGGGVDGGGGAELGTHSTTSAGGNSGHRHGISSDGNHNHTVTTVPPYHALYYIMKL